MEDGNFVTDVNGDTLTLQKRPNGALVARDSSGKPRFTFVPQDGRPNEYRFARMGLFKPDEARSGKAVLKKEGSELQVTRFDKEGNTLEALSYTPNLGR